MPKKGGGNSGPTSQIRWTKEGEPARFLKRALESGEIDPNETPKNVWTRYPLFKKYKLEVFRSQYNSLKTKLGLQVRTNGAGTEDDQFDNEGGDDDEGTYNVVELSLVFYLSSNILFVL